jgi:hypothetical protein
MYDVLNSNNYFISTLLRNPSADLWWLYIFNDARKIPLKYDGANQDIGTEPMLQSGLPNKIHNVEDASKYFQNMLKEQSSIDYFNKPQFSEDKKFADLYIYMDMTKPMRFVKV